MLDTLRASATGFLAKIMLALLVVMFGVWGIGDVIRNPSGRLIIATVGNAKISSNDYMQAMEREEETIRQIMGDNFSPEILKNPALSHHVLQQLVNRALFEQESQALGLIPSDADVVRHIRADPVFQDDKGNFDKRRFEEMLQGRRIAEKNYVEQVRQDMAIDLLLDTLTAKVPVPDIEARTLLAAREEGRNISLYNVKPTAITNIPAPDKAQVKAYYDAHSRDFTTPEYRTVSYVTMSSADVSKKITISEDDLRAAYKDRLDEFRHPERRVVEQLLYSSQAAAGKAYDMLKSGKSFAQIAEDTPILNKKALLIGKVARGNIMQGAAEKVFSLKAGQVTEPVKSPFGWHIFRVLSIEPASVSGFEEVRPMLEKDMAAHADDDALGKLANKFQDALAGGSTLAEAAHDLGLQVMQAGPFDQRGKAPDSDKPAILPDLNKFIETTFKTDENTESAMMLSKGGAYYILHVSKVTPERLRPLDEVRELAAAGWQNEDRQKRLGDLAKEIAKKFTTPAQRSAVIAKYHLDLVRTALIKRHTRVLDGIMLPPALVADVFSRKPEEGTDAYLTKDGSYLLAALNTVVPAPSPDSDPVMAAALQSIRKGLETLGQNEVLEQYAYSLTKKYPLSINDSALQSVQK